MRHVYKPNSVCYSLKRRKRKG